MSHSLMRRASTVPKPDARPEFPALVPPGSLVEGQLAPARPRGRGGGICSCC